MSAEQEARLQVARRMRESAEEEAEQAREFGQVLRIVVDFAENAKASGHLDEFEVLLKEVEEVVRAYGGEVPQFVRGRLAWLRDARPEQLPPRWSWPTEEQVSASRERVEAMLKAKEQAPEGGWGIADIVVARALGGATVLGRYVVTCVGYPSHIRALALPFVSKAELVDLRTLGDCQ